MISGIEPGKMSFSVLDPNSNITINASPSDTADIEIVDGVPTVKKKRGRPRKADKEEAAIAKIVDTKIIIGPFFNFLFFICSTTIIISQKTLHIVK